MTNNPRPAPTNNNNSKTSLLRPGIEDPQEDQIQESLDNLDQLLIL